LLRTKVLGKKIKVASSTTLNWNALSVNQHRQNGSRSHKGWLILSIPLTVLTEGQTVKKSAKVIIERYYPKLTLDFETNKRICDEIAIIASKRLRNKVRLAFSENFLLADHADLASSRLPATRLT